MNDRRTIQATLLAIFVGATSWGQIAAAEPQWELPSEETIQRYDVDIQIQADAKLRIVETIEVAALGHAIKRGIYRDFPIYSYTALGLRKKHPLNVLSATRDGQPERFRVQEPDENRPFEARIYLGEEGKTLPPGIYLYTIEYVADDWLAHGDAYDELYWNVTGNFWDFPIRQSSVTIHLPAKFANESVTINAWTGASGRKGQAWRTLDALEQEVKLETTETLGRREGWTVSVKFPVGAVTFPAGNDAYGQLLNDNADIFLTLLTLGCALGVYVLGWIMVGRDPSPGAVLVEDAPPADVSPAAARYVANMGFDNTCLATALVYAETQGAIQLRRDESGDYSATRSQGFDFSSLPDDVQALLHGLFANGGTINFRKSQHQTISSAISDFKAKLAANHRGVHFLVNGWWTLWGASISIVGILMAILSSPNYALGLFFALWLSFWTIGVFMLGAMVLAAWKQVLSGDSGVVQRGLATGGAIFITAFATPFFAAEFIVLGIFAAQVSFIIPFAVILLVLLGWRFYKWMKRPTHEGRLFLDHLDGYRRWLEGEFVRRVQYAATPEEGASLFDARLPWAMALGLADGWYAQLGERVLTASRFNSNVNSRQPRSLFRTSSMSSGMFSGAALAGALGGAVHASSFSPSKGGGSGGGGSSGGGGGGGGGGGW